MEETKNIQYEKDETNKVVDFLKNNILNFILVAVISVFLVRDMLQINESGKTVLEIIADSILSLTMGMIIKIIFSKKGILSAETSKSYIAMMNDYSKEIERTDNHIDELDDFCDKKNDQRYARVQKNILRHARIKYDDFINKSKEEVCKNEEMAKYWDKAQHAKIQLITPENLLSETDSSDEKGKKEITLQEYQRRKNSGRSLSALMCALIFGYFTVVLIVNMSGFLWSVIQVATWLLFGISTYMEDYFYVKNVYQNKIYRKISYLKEFNMDRGKK